MSLNRQYDIGSYVRVFTAQANFGTTQGSDDAALTTQDGDTIDRDEDGLRRYYSCKAVVSAHLTADSSQRTATMVINVQHSSDGTSWDNFSTATNPDAVTWGSTSTGGDAGTTGGTANGVVSQNVNLQGARQFIRVQLPAPTFPDCSSSIILTGHGVVVFGGGDELPAT